MFLIRVIGKEFLILDFICCIVSNADILTKKKSKNVYCFSSWSTISTLGHLSNSAVLNISQQNVGLALFLLASCSVLLALGPDFPLRGVYVPLVK